ncbi:hypothetical protein [Sporichthya sp.]|uniref:hypothetical protein n=1 Tax=Sporichthya sp. TaxID=65475 RepID=UPI0017F76B7C|nr:hypothetical protein [Sporichthya sp.]MBA3741825.1 hypothetical protein [Sporichthya sp.]
MLASLIARDPGFTQPVKDISEPAYTIFTVLSALVLVGCMGYAARQWLTARDGVPALFLAGGGICSLFEPLLDVNGGVWYPATGGVAYLSLLDVRLPVFVLTSYIWIIGGQAYLFWRALDQRWPANRMWPLIGFVVVTDVVTEFIGVGLGAYGYYGNQPFEVLGFPLWYPFVNMVGPLLGALVFLVLRDWLRGPRAVLGVLCVTIGMTAGYSVVGWPLWTGLQENAPLWVMYLLCAPTLLLAYLAVRLALTVAGTPGLNPSTELESDSDLASVVQEPRAADEAAGTRRPLSTARALRTREGT